jgi:F420-non-reducing hydrogenase small subunit
MSQRPKLAFYWAASCGGCEITIVELGMRLVEVSEKVDIVFWPCAMDFKYDDVRAMQDKEIDVCFFNGGIRNDENEHIATLLRRKSKILVAFGACAHMGGIPSLANQYDKESMLYRVFDEIPSNDDSRGTRPQPTTHKKEGDIEIPILYDRVKTLAQTVEVDYYMPGCPPVADQVWNVFQALLAGNIPEKGSKIGVDPKSNCDACARQKGKSSQRISEFKRPHEVQLDPETCFLTQGVVCYGAATQAGCGLPCVKANFPCRGCYGPPEGVFDQGAKLISEIGALIDTSKPEELKKIMEGFVDPVGTAYRFGLADSILNEMKYKLGNK